MSAAYAENTSGIVKLNAGNYRNHKQDQWEPKRAET